MKTLNEWFSLFPPGHRAAILEAHRSAPNSPQTLDTKCENAGMAVYWATAFDKAKDGFTWRNAHQALMTSVTAEEIARVLSGWPTLAILAPGVRVKGRNTGRTGVITHRREAYDGDWGVNWDNGQKGSYASSNLEIIAEPPAPAPGPAFAPGVRVKGKHSGRFGTVEESAKNGYGVWKIAWDNGESSGESEGTLIFVSGPSAGVTGFRQTENPPGASLADLTARWPTTYHADIRVAAEADDGHVYYLKNGNVGTLPDRLPDYYERNDGPNYSFVPCALPLKCWPAGGLFRWKPRIKTSTASTASTESTETSTQKDTPMKNGTYSVKKLEIKAAAELAANKAALATVKEETEGRAFLVKTMQTFLDGHKKNAPADVTTVIKSVTAEVTKTVVVDNTARLEQVIRELAALSTPDIGWNDDVEFILQDFTPCNATQTRREVVTVTVAEK